MTSPRTLPCVRIDQQHTPASQFTVNGADQTTVSVADAERIALQTDVLDGFWQEQPQLPARWFYDDIGSRLFEEITRLPEYYPTRRERQILTERADQIAALDADVVVELGAGSAAKTRVLLDAITRSGRPTRYVPSDISADMLAQTADDLRRDFPQLRIDPLVADFQQALRQLPGEPGTRLLLFLGGTIGNFDEHERAGFLQTVGAALGAGDHFLLGLDLVKDPTRLLAAYDDAAGVTAAFNRNVIRRVSTTLSAHDLSADDFAHVACWDPRLRRVEMRLRAVIDVTAHFPTLGRTWQLPAGAHLRTEICRKFTPAEIPGQLAQAGLAQVALWTDEAGDFAVVLARKVRAGDEVGQLPASRRLPLTQDA